MPAARSVRCRCSTGRPLSASTVASPAAWACCSVPKLYGRSGIGRSSDHRAGQLQEDPVRVAALVVLPGGVQEPRAPAEGGLQPGPAGHRRPQRRRRGVARAGPGRPGSRRSRSSGAAVEQRRAAPRDGAGAGQVQAVAEHLDRPVGAGRFGRWYRPAESSRLRACFLASSTFGWSNGLMPISRPATAVAYSHSSSLAAQRSGRWRHPSRRTAGSPGRSRRRSGRGAPGSRPGRRPAKPGAAGSSTTTGSRPRPFLPVDSAISCSAQSPNPLIPEPKSAKTTLSQRASALWACPSSAPSCRPGLSALVHRQRGGGRRGVVQQAADVGTGQPGRHQPERGQRAVPAADVRVGQEHLAVTGVLGDAAAAASPGR